MAEGIMGNAFKGLPLMFVVVGKIIHQGRMAQFCNTVIYEKKEDAQFTETQLNTSTTRQAEYRVMELVEVKEDA